MKMLVIEDDGGSREILMENLRQRGWDVSCVTQPAEALALLERERFDAVLTDVHLPGNTGTQHINNLLAARTDVPVFVMTGYPSLEVCLQCWRGGVAAFLVKPFRIDQLMKDVELELARRRDYAELKEYRLRARGVIQEGVGSSHEQGLGQPGA